MQDDTFVCNIVLSYLEDKAQTIDSVEAVQASIDEMAHPAEKALQELEQVVGMAKDWEYGNAICSRFLSIWWMLCDVMAGAMLGQELQ